MLLKLFPWKFMQPIIGLLSFLFLCLNIFLCGVAIHLVAFIGKLFNCRDAWQRIWMDRCYRAWVFLCGVWFRDVLGMNWHLDQSFKVDNEKWHLVVANHQSWVDAFVVLLQTQGRIPMPRIFMKDTLVWLPLVGTATKLLGFVQVKRYSKKKIAKRPELAERDRKATELACEPLMQTPSSIMTFAEGTRFSAKKHMQQQSPYQHLLKPRAGGIWTVLEAMPQRFDSVTDISIVYGSEALSFWDLLCGRIQPVYVKVRYIPIPEVYQTIDSSSDRESFYQWLNQYWHEKDANIVTDRQQCSKLEFQRNGPIKKGNSLQN